MTKIETAIHAGQITPQMSFNQKVWALTSRIPRGQVTTYADIARKLKTRGYRAVGNALNKNPYAPAVPCHRVVGSDGKLTGYAGGLAKKQRLLEREGVAITGGKVLAQHLLKTIPNPGSPAAQQPRQNQKETEHR
ncbi:MAG TPA: MGMT family protein [Tepidisphaeraceae bacterium]|jgi:methylated-DNA-[protein]-cysteine S-methyltransferase|nr:MGMT family protein [Tepidisphaeraceae bacterium]